MEDTSDLFQEERGFLRTGKRWSVRCCVVASDWPSWSLALDAMGVVDVVTVMPTASANVLDEVRATRVGKSLVDYDVWSRTRRDLMKEYDLVLIQGSDYFVNEVQEWFDACESLRVFGVVPCHGEAKRGNALCDQKSWKGGKPIRANHVQTGGITRGQWKVYGDLKLTGLKSSPVKRVLRHLLVTTEMGIEITDPKLIKDRVLQDQRIPSGKRHIRVAAPCCFSKDKKALVDRDLTDRELMGAYDIEEGAQRALLQHARHSGKPLSRAFVLEAPVKVLYSLTQTVLKVYLSKEEVDSIGARENVVKEPFASLNPEDDGATRASNTNELSSRKRAADSTPNVDLKRVRPDLENASEKRSQVATKSDDAPVEVRDWDVWLVNNYQHPEHITVKSGANRQTAFQIKNPAKILVCKPGSYSEETHGRLFDAFRNLLIRRARRNAFRGLAAYLRQKHGSQAVEFTVKYHKRNTSGSRNKRRKRKRKQPFDTEENEELNAETLDLTRIRLPRDEGRRIAFGLSGRRKVTAPSWTFKPHKPADPKKKAGSANDPRVELHKDLTVGRDALSRLANSSWWGWDQGSTLFFWRWPARHRKAIRDGTKLFVKKELLPHHFKRQLWPRDESQRSKMAEKIDKVRSRGYILPGEVNSLTGFFAVPKGEDDIRIVYDATACGLNAALWAPNFALPSIDSVLRNSDSRTWFSDIDLGEMFLNYFLDEDLREYAGVDVREIGATKWERWERTLMGFRPSPYVCTQTFGWGEDAIKGDRKDRDNPFRWDSVRMNLPGDTDYDPTMPWVYKWDERNNRLASHFCCYIDDIRGMGGTEGVCRKATRRVASWINYLGQQDAPRKRRPPSRTPGAWAGAMCLSKEDGLYVTCTQKKWDKAKAIVEHWHDEVCVNRRRSVNASQMERDVGFLVHLSRTFPAVFPYLKGFYLSLNSWRKGRNDEGWKYSMAEWRAALDLDDTLPSYRVRDEARIAHPGQSHTERPEMVDTVPRLGMDIKAIQDLLTSAEPVHRLVRGDKVQSAKFAFGDASGGGFGSSWEAVDIGGKDCDGINYRFGTWDKETSKESSNYRELRNLTETLELMAADGTLAGTELFLFTDNSTAESAFDKGSSSSRLLFELVLRLRKLEMNQSCKLHLSHVSGKRMIDQGSDGLSRGNLAEGVMRGADMKGFIPINKTAFERTPKLRNWLDTWTQSECNFLEPTGWYTSGQELVEDAWEINSDGRRLPVTRPGTFVWSPPPVAAGIAMEELRRSRHKSEKSTHVVVIPRLFTTEWRKQLHKAADVVLTLPAGHPAWPLEMHEPLTIAILFPFISHRPWQLRRTPKLLDLGNAVQKVWESSPESEGPLLRELWNLQRTVEDLSPSVASDLLYGKSSGGLPNCTA